MRRVSKHGVLGVQIYAPTAMRRIQYTRHGGARCPLWMVCLIIPAACNFEPLLATPSPDRGYLEGLQHAPADRASHDSDEIASTGRTEPWTLTQAHSGNNPGILCAFSGSGSIQPRPNHLAACVAKAEVPHDNMTGRRYRAQANWYMVATAYAEAGWPPQPSAEERRLAMLPEHLVTFQQIRPTHRRHMLQVRPCSVLMPRCGDTQCQRFGLN